MGIIKKIDTDQETQGTQEAKPVVKAVTQEAKAAENASKEQEYLKARSRVKTVIKVAIGVIVALVIICLIAGVAGSGTKEGQVKVSSSSSSFTGEYKDDVKTLLEKDGFTNIELRAEGDLITGMLHQEGDVDTVSIDGKTSFSSGTAFNKDAKVVIAYHSFPEGSASNTNVNATANEANNANAASSNTDTAATTANASASSNGSYDSAEFRKTMDDYEAFIDSYVEFMQQYNSDPSNAASMAVDYAKMFAQYTKLSKEMEDMDTSNLSDEDLAYYTDTMNRCSQKLLSVTA